MNPIRSFNINPLKVFSVTEEDIRDVSHSSRGNQTKWFKDSYWIKKNFLGYESLSEVICSKLLKNIKDLDFVEYEFCDVKFRGGSFNNCCCSKDFLEPGEEIVTIARLLNLDESKMKNFMRLSTDYRVMLVLEEVSKSTDLDITEYLGRQIYLDSIILNEDRHLHNIAVLYSDSGYRECPIFDNGGSLLSDVNYYPLDASLIRNVRSVKSKPFNTNFRKQVELFRNLGVAPLKIRIDNLDLSTIKYSTVSELNRAKNVLSLRLKETEGLCWEKI